MRADDFVTGDSARGAGQALKNLPGLHPRMGGIGRCHRRHVILASHFPGNGVIDLESIQHHSYSLLSWCRNTNIPQ